MLKVNLKDIPDEVDKSPKGKFQSVYKQISKSLGRDETSSEARKRHPFDLAQVRLPAGATLCPYHAESAQWEMYLVVSGRGSVRHPGGTTEVVAGDTFIFPPGEAHTLSNPAEEDFVYYVFSNNPVGDCCYYPDSDKWAVGAGEKSAVLQAQEATYFDGEE